MTSKSHSIQCKLYGKGDRTVSFSNSDRSNLAFMKRKLRSPTQVISTQNQLSLPKSPHP
ncbi:hypothetical protein [Nostoc sp. UHCC 0302]|uniref:hypothetical protein n=1 Tax=Nostoc sp. UHCC 0302 TaxID=3134896 RepID=UPI00311C8E97